jgi:hypothetical protein
MLTRRNSCAFLFAIYLAAMSGLTLHAQSPSIQPTVAHLAYDNLPDAPGQQTSTSQTENQTENQTESQAGNQQQAGASIMGTVADANGATVANGLVTLQAKGSSAQRTLTTDSGGFFHFANLEPGTYRLTIISSGFAPWIQDNLVLHLNESYLLPPITLQVATASTNVDVTFTQHDLAEEQIKQEEKQRIFAIIPNFYVSYNWNAAPLTVKQKFKLAFRNATDPVAFLGAGFAAGIEQWDDGYSGYGQGAQGYFKRFGASYTDAFSGNMFGGAIMPSIFHQDPRYFYKGTGTVRSRIFYAISTVVICKGDNGHWQPNYSNVLGSLAGAGLSNLYYPSTDRHGAELTIRNSLIGSASGAIGALFQEFLLKKISKGVAPQPGSPVTPNSTKN